MEQRDVLAAAGATVLTLGLLTAFDVVRGAEIAWLFNGGVAALIGLFVASARSAAPAS